MRLLLLRKILTEIMNVHDPLRGSEIFLNRGTFLQKFELGPGGFSLAELMHPDPARANSTAWNNRKRRLTEPTRHG